MNILNKENKGKKSKVYQINQSHPSLFHETVLTPNFQMNNFQPRLQVNCMISDFTICTVYTQSSTIHILSSTLTPHTRNKIKYFKLTSHHILVTCRAFIMKQWIYLTSKKNKGYLNHISSLITLTSFNFKFPFEKETLYFRLFTLTSQKAHSSTQFALYERHRLVIIRFPLVNTSDPKYDFTFFHLPGKQEQL